MSDYKVSAQSIALQCIRVALPRNRFSRPHPPRWKLKPRLVAVNQKTQIPTPNHVFCKQGGIMGQINVEHEA